MENLKVISETDRYWVVEKPAGLLSQKDSGGDDSLVQEIQKISGAKFVGLVHRLDRNTSGLMILAKDPRTADKFTRDLQNNQLRRRYEALLAGHIHGEFSWSHHLEKNPNNNHVTVFRRPSKNSKEARLHGHSLRNLQVRRHEVTHVEIELDTGRSHQIRCQAAFENHPIVGDHRYGKKLPEPLKDFSRPALHSSFLSFVDPETSELMTFNSPMDRKFFEADLEGDS